MEISITFAPKEFAARTPELFHYTNFAGLAGIHQSNTLWATHYRHLNDSSEITLLKNIAVQELAKRIETRLDDIQRDNTSFRRRLDQNGGLIKTSHEQAEKLVSVYYEVFFEGNTHAKFGAPYITSFCTHTDLQPYEKENGLLSQWRGYSEGGGYCIVFDTDSVIGLLAEEFGSHYWLHLHLNHVHYATAGAPISEHTAAAIDQLDLFFARSLASASSGNLGTLSIPPEAITTFVENSTLLKHEGFREESEIRIVAIPGGQKNYELVQDEHKDFCPPPIPIIYRRENRGKDCEYLRLFERSKRKLPIKRIIVGPSSHQDENYVAAKALQLDEIKLVKSKTPFLGN